MSEPAPPSSPPSPPPARNFPVLRWLRRRYENWRLRHLLPINFALHMVGIPLALGGLLLLLLWPFVEIVPWYWAVGAFVLGYLLQYVGHLAEGNDVGEWAAIKRLLGLPYVGIAPRWNLDDPDRL